MIAYFADRTMNILGQATTELPEGMRIVDDLLTEDVETGIAILEGYLPYNENTRKAAESCCDIGNYILLLKNEKSRFFTITNIEADTKRQEIYFYAEDAGLDLLNEYCITWAADKAYSMAWYVEYFTADSGFEIGINEAEGLSLKLEFDESTAAERLADLAEQFGGFEISFSFEIENLTVTRKLINIHKKRGEDYGVTLRLNREITRILTTKSIENLATGLYPIGGVADDKNEYTTLLNYKYDDGDIYVSGNCLISRDANAIWSRYVWNKEPNRGNSSGAIIKVKKYDETEQKKLCELAVADLKKMCEVEVNYEVDIAYLPDNVSIGDRVNIIDEAGELYLSTRILKLEESESRKKYSATLGEHLLKKSGISEKVEVLAADFARNSVSVQRAESIANNARSAANEAQAAANTAAEGATYARSVANEARTVAETAKATATTATEMAQAAEVGVEQVKECVSHLNSSMIAAAAAADDTYIAVEIAEKKAIAAETAAQNAVEIAEAAATAAGAAQTAAQEAEAKATEAQETAADAIEQSDAAIKERAESIELSVATIKETTDGNTADIERANALLQLLSDQIKTLVVGEDGASLMTQTATGWQFDFSGILDLLKNHTGLLEKYDDHIKFTTYENEPCIELGEDSTEFKVLITNTRIMFCEGAQVPCYISNNEFVAENVSVKDELRFGQWAWAVRANGNFGLTWKGAAE